MNRSRCAVGVLVTTLMASSGPALASVATPALNVPVVPFGRDLVDRSPPPVRTRPAADVDDQVEADVGRARRQFDAGRYQEAVGTLEKAVAEGRSTAEVWFWLGRAYLELRDADRAIKAGNRAVELKPGAAEFHRWLGRMYGEKAERERSFLLARRVRQQFEEAVRLDGASIAARRDLMEFYLDAPAILGGGKDKAWRQADAIAALDPIAGRLARAAYWASRDDLTRTEAEYRAVLDERPVRLDPYLEAAAHYVKQKNTVALNAVVDAAARLEPGDPRVTYYRGVLDVLRGAEPAVAERSLKTYLATVPSRSDWPSPGSAHEWLGRLYESVGKGPEAAAEYRAALALDPDRRAAKEGLQRVGGR